MNFTAIDVETANCDCSSICQIGIVKIENNEIVDKWSTYINPEDYFDSFNTSINGISESNVKNAPTFKEIYKELNKRISNQILIHHTSFDKTSINRSCEKYKLNLIETNWVDSAKIVKRTWEDFSKSGYGLANVADFLNIDFKHHDALEDAMAAAKITCNACEKSQIMVEEWYNRQHFTIDRCFGRQSAYSKTATTIHLDGNPEGFLYGEVMVFTGTLSLPRKEAAKMASDMGCHVDSNVNMKTTMLVVGIQDTNRLAGYEKSSKHRKVEDLIQKGFDIKILSENDFISLHDNETIIPPIKTFENKKPIISDQSIVSTEINIPEKKWWEFWK
jgi:DNA polymerase-3 subunit epsilon